MMVDKGGASSSSEKDSNSYMTRNDQNMSPKSLEKHAIHKKLVLVAGQKGIEGFDKKCVTLLHTALGVQMGQVITRIAKCRKRRGYKISVPEEIFKKQKVSIPIGEQSGKKEEDVFQTEDLLRCLKENPFIIQNQHVSTKFQEKTLNSIINKNRKKGF